MLALSSRRVGRAARRVAAAAEVARALGFASVHAAVPPSDAEGGRAALDAFGVSLAGVSTEPVGDLGALESALARAVEAARTLREPRVVVDLGTYAAARRESREAAVDALARGLHEAYGRFGGVSLAVRPGPEAGGLLGLVETEWLLDALAGKVLGVWLDPWRASRAEAAVAAAVRGTAPAKAPASALDWADRLGRRASGVVLQGPGVRDGGRGLPEEGALDWSTLRGLLPARAVRVLDVGPEAGDADVVETRRRFEEAMGW